MSNSKGISVTLFYFSKVLIDDPSFHDIHGMNIGWLFVSAPYKYANEENAIARYIRSLHAHNKYTYIVAQE